MGLDKFTRLLATHLKIALDSSFFIYHIEENQKYLELTRIVFEDILTTGKIKAVGSTIILTEILTKPYNRKRPDLAMAYKELILGFPNLSIFAPDERICDTAAQIRSKYNFRTPDAIHIATAQEQNASAILTNDSRWKKVKEVKSIVLEEFVG